MLHHRMRRAAAGIGGVGDGGTGTTAFRASAESATTDKDGSSTLSVSMPTNSDGDLIFVWIFTESASFSSPITPPSGWTTINAQTGNVCGLYVKVASSEPSSYTWTLDDRAQFTAIAVSMSGASNYTSATIRDSNTTNSVTMPANGLVLAFFGQESSSITPVTPAGMTAVDTGEVNTTLTSSIAYYGPASTGVISGKTDSGFSSFLCDSVMVGIY